MKVAKQSSRTRGFLRNGCLATETALQKFCYTIAQRGAVWQRWSLADVKRPKLNTTWCSASETDGAESCNLDPSQSSSRAPAQGQGCSGARKCATVGKEAPFSTTAARALAAIAQLSPKNAPAWRQLRILAPDAGARGRQARKSERAAGPKLLRFLYNPYRKLPFGLRQRGVPLCEGKFFDSCAFWGRWPARAPENA